MDIERIYRERGIHIAGEHDRHYRAGWVNVPCPHCTGNPGYHLGFNKQGEFFVCWRCGSHPVQPTLKKLLNMSGLELKDYLPRFATAKRTVRETPVNIKPFKLPAPLAEELPAPHRRYLIKRGFNPDELTKKWELKFTTIFAKMGGLDFSRRIVVPVEWGGETVSFLARDITDVAPQRYLVCPADREKINIKQTLYGKPEFWGGIGICVEGVTDVWKMGVHSFGVYGIKYTPKQVRLIVKNFKAVAVLFDDDPQAVKQANKLVSELNFRGCPAFRVPITGDPGALSLEQARELKDMIFEKAKNLFS